MRRRVWLDRAGFALSVVAGLAAFVYLLGVEGARRPDPRVSPARAPAAARRAPADRAGADPRRNERQIRIGWTAWADAEIVAHLLRRVLEDRLGYEVQLVMADIGIQYQGVANGDLDVMVMAWLPVTHADYWTRFAGSVVNLGPIYTRARLGWAVPAHVPEGELGSIRDLARPEVRTQLRGRIHGIDPGSGLMRASERARRIYGLDQYELVSSSGAAMTAALGRAIERREWIVVAAWNPHWMFAEWDLRYLDDPEGALGGRERVHVIVRRGFDRDHPPEVLDVLTRLFIPLPELEEALRRSTRGSVDSAVRAFLEDHASRVDYWVTGELGPADRGDRRPPAGSDR